MSTDLSAVSDSYLELVFGQTTQSDPKRAAEMAYALAILAAKSSNHERAQQFGTAAVSLFLATEQATLESAAAVHTVIAGIAIPDIIHADVVRNRLETLGVSLH